MRNPIFAALAVAALTLAGCVGTQTTNQEPGTPNEAPTSPFEDFTPAQPSFDFSTVVDPDHGAHEAGRLHAIGNGLRLVGHSGAGDILPEGMRGSITQVDVWNGYAVTPGFQDGPAFIIFDIHDPKNPKPISYHPTVADGWTARFSDDGEYLFYGCQIVGPPYTLNGQAIGDCRDPNALHPGTPAPGGISVFDVKDKTKPRFVDFIATNGSHNLQVANINGSDYVFTSATRILKFDREAGRLTEVARVPGRHDSTVMMHPVTGDWLLYTGTGQLAIYNVNVPEDPVAVIEAGDWKEGIGWHEQVPFPFLVDGRVLLALAGETFESNQGVPDQVTIVDITDPANPVKLSSWQPPFQGQVPWKQYTFSVHEMAATPQGQLAIGWYHGGVWVIDLSTQERQANPAVVAAFQPNKEINVIPSLFAQTPIPMVPFVWSAAWDQRGYLVVPDMHTGLYVLEPEWGLLPMLDGGA